MDSLREQILAALSTRLGASRALRPVELSLYDNDIDARDDEVTAYDSVRSTILARVEYVRQLSETELDTVSKIMCNKMAEIIFDATHDDAGNLELTLGDLCQDIYEIESKWEVRESGSVTVACYVTFRVPYFYDRGDPFNNTSNP